METVVLSSKYRLVLPRGARFLVPERPVRGYRGIVRGARLKALREKKDRF
jgi:hypothetical protein